MYLSVVFLVSLLVAAQGASIGFNASTSCTSACSWAEAFLFDSNGVLPGPEDIVDLKGSTSNVVINVDVDVTINGFYIGEPGNPKVTYTLNIGTGRNFKVGSGTSGNIVFGANSVVSLEQAASLSCGGQMTTNGVFKVAGLVSLGGGGGAPGLTVESLANTNKPLDGPNQSSNLLLLGGTIETPQEVRVKQTLLDASLTGYGRIAGNVNIAGGRLSPGVDDNTVGAIEIEGRLILGSGSKSTFSIKSKTEFDHVSVTGSLNADGDLILSAINKFESLIGQRFYIMNHTEMIGGFDSVHGDGLSSVFNDKWSIRPDQENTIVVYGSASSVVVSAVVLIACLVATLL